MKTVISSEVENGAAGEAATWTGRRRLSEREVSESNPVALSGNSFSGILRLHLPTRFSPLATS